MFVYLYISFWQDNLQPMAEVRISFFCLSVCFFVRTERPCFSLQPLVGWDKFFTIGAFTHVEYFNDNYDVIDHVVCQPYLKNGKTLDLYIWNRTKENFETWHIASTPDVEWVLFLMMSQVPSLWRHNCRCGTPHPISTKIFEGHLGIKLSTERISWHHRSRDSAAILFKKRNLQKSSSLKWLNRSRWNFTHMTACPCRTKGSHIWCHWSHGLAAILDLP